MVKSHEALTNRKVAPAQQTGCSSPFGRWLLDVLDSPHLRETFQQLCQRTITGRTLGLPRWVSATELHGYLRPSDALVELARSPLVEPFDLGVAFSGEHATQLVDLVLGGNGNASLAGVCGAPSDAECGVLAYAAARLCATGTGEWLVRDVRRPQQRQALGERSVVWPFSVATSGGNLDGMVVLSRALALTLDSPLVLALSVSDACPPQVLDELAVGDVLVSDSWPLTHTIDGVSGDVTGSLDGSETKLLLRIAGRKLHGRGLAKLDRGAQLELVLARRSYSFIELAELAGGGELPLALAPEPVQLRAAGRTLANGELVTYRGSVGIRIRELITENA